ncbi:hypothetical protein HBI65_022420 [Parastagonospora nodorum]|nr:hypothetical protein HBI09_104770 [Parastagonospora nodorum]KAH5198918.1 hypothetical protein HBH76_019990 [Parastagonospora nodorum]KAH5441188.1 hypothetical protein HBI47_040630 [Parastagonospora nodorum]KAH6107512.1 hypothetical protein HBI65_022420 [Parastagonospora nodorum]KAH6549815.1 hypothetical protein HBI07_056180 [Parastagonospora nodorum]
MPSEGCVSLHNRIDLACHDANVGKVAAKFGSSRPSFQGLVALPDDSDFPAPSHLLIKNSRRILSRSTSTSRTSRMLDVAGSTSTFLAVRRLAIPPKSDKTPERSNQPQQGRQMTSQQHTPTQTHCMDPCPVPPIAAHP